MLFKKAQELHNYYTKVLCKQYHQVVHTGNTTFFPAELRNVLRVKVKQKRKKTEEKEHQPLNVGSWIMCQEVHIV